MTTNEILEQAQVFASAWSLVGSRFDSGDAIDSANNEEERLGQMIDELVKERNAYAKAADEMAAAHKVERDALKDAALLALDALEGAVDFDPDSKAQWSVSGGAYEAHECNSAIEALKAVL